MNTKLTTRQKEVYDFIERHIIEHSTPPTLREISNAFGWFGPNAALAHLKALVKKGHATYTPKQSRSVRLVRGVHCPHCGVAINGTHNGDSGTV